MFTGIIEEIGTVKKIERSPEKVRLTVASPFCGAKIEIGDSLAINGCCLTVAGISGKLAARLLTFDILGETWMRTNLKFCTPNCLVNLERPLAASGRFHGHIVSGHIDGTTKIKSFEQIDADWRLEIAVSRKDLKYLIQKGSVALDGISLTIAAIASKTCTVWIIPHTRDATTLKSRKRGDELNIEFDLVGKYVERLLHFSGSGSAG